jgi:chemotaxis response regulator CheB
MVLMDIRMPELDGIEATRRLLALAPATRVLMLTTFDLDEYVSSLPGRRLGLPSQDSAARPARRRRPHVHMGEALLANEHAQVDRAVRPAAIRGAGTGHTHASRLGCLYLLARSHTDVEIARARRRALYRQVTSLAALKLDLRDRVQAVVFAYESGLVRPVRHERLADDPPRSGEFFPFRPGRMVLELHL